MLSFSFIVSLEKNHLFFMGSDPESSGFGAVLASFCSGHFRAPPNVCD